MPNKTILLYDASNHPLRVPGIRVELFDAIAGTYLAGDDSKNLDPTTPDPQSDQWGVDLSFTAGTNPLDIMIKDPLYRYPGNTVRYLNGQLQDQVYLDLTALPLQAGGQITALQSGNASDVVSWIERGRGWSEVDKDAVLNLVFNYIRLVAARPFAVAMSDELRGTAENWEEALRGLGIDPALFQQTKTHGPGTPMAPPILINPYRTYPTQYEPDKTTTTE